MSKIVQKEKERQDDYLDENFKFVYAENQLEAEIDSHKQSLINLKEYIEDSKIEINKIMERIGFPDMDKDSKLWSVKNLALLKIYNQYTDDIKELNKMIEKY